MKEKLKHFITKYKYLLGIIILFFVILIIKVFPTFSVTTTSSVWDGTVATSFNGGDGSINNPYQIKTGSELAYFKSIYTDSSYFNKYYELTNNIDLNGYDFSNLETAFFSGSFNGNGYCIYNFSINNANSLNEYSLFSSLNNATIKNVNLYNIYFNKESLSDSKMAFLTVKATDSSFLNISLYDLNIAIDELGESNLLSGFLIDDNGGNSLYNINVDLNSNINQNISSFIYNYNNSSYGNILIKNNDYNEVNNIYAYNIVDNNIVFVDNYSQTSILNDFNEGLDGYKWVYKNNNFRYQIVAPMEISKATISSQPSGIVGSTIYVNDFDADQNYYTGLNYTTNSGSLPTQINKNLYNSGNLIRVQMNYHGSNINSTFTGHISLTETQTDYVYYKVYPINNNGTISLTDDYVLIELIDNPYSDLPTDMAFNNWYTNYVGAKVIYYNDYYTRYVKAPITYTDNVPDDLTIDMYASWTFAKVGTMTSSWNTAFASLDEAGMHYIDLSPIPIYSAIDLNGYYTKKTISYGSSQAGYYNSSGSLLTGTCRGFWFSSCTVYHSEAGLTYDSSLTYYKLENGTMTQVNNATEFVVTITGYNTNPLTLTSLAGFYNLVTIPNGSSYAGYYDANGNYQESGTCSSSSGCSYYEMIPYYDTSGNVSAYNSNLNYYYLATRDTNIIVMKSNVSSTWSNAYTKPFTLTGIHNGTNYKNSYYWNLSSTNVHCYSNVRIENLRINSSTTLATGQSIPSDYGYIMQNYSIFYASWYNVKVGRGISQYNTSNATNAFFIAGSTSSVGSSSSLNKQKVIIESGVYNNLSLASVASLNSDNDYYINTIAIYGSDYDRVNNDNSHLNIVYCAAGSWGGSVRGSSSNDIVNDLTIKSGSFGSNQYDYTTGIYVGGRYGGTQYAAKKITVEGGYIYNLIGEPSSASSLSTTNVIYMYIKGGAIDSVVGGAGLTTTYGNRIIQITGGTINYNVFGGSNGYQGSEGEGQLDGDSYLYIGGNATIGTDNLVNNGSTLYGAEAGSVFGIGNGVSTYSTIGSNNNSYVIIDGNATIKKNIYGGGNYGATGVNSSSSTNTTSIIIHGGTINGSVYGGGNNNGAGSSTKTSTINISMDGGTVAGSIYGGSRSLGTIYGSVNLNIIGGTINTDVYGGGEGGYASSDALGTYVDNNVNIVVGNTNIGPTITGSVYGGSAFGTVNATSYDAASNTKQTNVTVNKGTINSVFGGAKGNATYTPYVKGNIVVNINGGTISYVYGGFDQTGTPEGTVYVYLNGGVIGSAFGGGNNTSIDTTNIYLQGSSVNNLFGGSNQSGNVTETNVTISSGSANMAFGGNNLGTSCATTNVTMTGGTIISELYGGGNAVGTTTTNMNLQGSTNTVPYVFGGGKSADATTTNVLINGISATNIFGGSNTTGVVTTSNVTMTSGTVINVYGGNNSGTSTVTTYVIINGGTPTNVYGGGNEALAGTTNVTINGGTVANAFGGGYEAMVTTTNITATGGTTGSMFGGGNNAGATTTNVFLNGGTLTNVYGGSNEGGTVNQSYIKTTGANGSTVTNLYGGNNRQVLTGVTNLEISKGIFTNIYGGGNQAPINTSNVLISGGTINYLYGGGKLAVVNNDVSVNITGGTINNNAYGGGDEAIVTGNTLVNMNGGLILGSIYGGGNGVAALVLGNTQINISGTSVIGSSACTLKSQCSVFAGGNASSVGATTSEKVATANIAGGTIYGNVYGGANTSRVYGVTFVNIGDAVTLNANMTKSTILIKGNIYGGGDANASGSDTYDWKYISVTTGITVNINGNNYDLTIDGSIFGSGNASISSGYSYVNIYNFGTYAAPKKITSIQRTKLLVIDNSALAIHGAMDRTNEYSTELFTFSIIDELDLKNSSTLFLENNTNFLLTFRSLDSTGALARVSIDKTNQTVDNYGNDNRLYALEGININVALDAAATTYGEVKGMTFFGVYRIENGEINTIMYDQSYGYGDLLNWGDTPRRGSYVLGLHPSNYVVSVDGFYSNFIDEDTSLNNVDYITPTPDDAAFYRWIVGELVSEYTVDLDASKYSTLGAKEMNFLDFISPNTDFEILGFDYSGLSSGINLVESSQIPKIAASGTDADSNFSLVVETGTSGWLTDGKTTFVSDNPSVIGTKMYVGENSNDTPSLVFYLYHSKNITSAADMGTVQIYIMAVTRINDLSSEAHRVVVNVNLKRVIYTTNNYEATLTSGRKYSMFTSTVVDITSKSSISAYYSLFADNQVIYQTGDFRSLVSNYVLPEGTKITMIDLSGTSPEYYYHVITATDVSTATSALAIDGEVSYHLSMFELMGAVNSGVYYSDATKNGDYYDSNSGISSEEFIFIIDFEDTNISSNALGNSLVLELRNNQDQTKISVLGNQYASMFYDIYADSDAYINITGTTNKQTLYAGESLLVDLTTTYTQERIGSSIIYDTKYYDSKVGIMISLVNANNDVISGTSLMGLYYTINGTNYYPNIDGTTRIKISDRVGNIKTWITMHTENANLSTGQYNLRIESYGSPDGIYYGAFEPNYINLPVYIINDIYGLDISINAEDLILDKTTGKNLNDSNVLGFTILYNSGLANPSLNMKLYRRLYDTIYDTNYEEVDLIDYLDMNLVTYGTNEYVVSGTPSNNATLSLTTKANLLSGTYKLKFILYDGTTAIGNIDKYIIIK